LGQAFQDGVLGEVEVLELVHKEGVQVLVGHGSISWSGRGTDPANPQRPPPFRGRCGGSGRHHSSRLGGELEFADSEPIRNFGFVIRALPRPCAT
jgi:hypothetical protein